MQDLLSPEKGDQAALLDRIRNLVLSGEFPPGANLPEAYLAQEFDVSRTPVREALKQLQHEGLVEIRPKVGSFVREPTRREIIELFQLKESLEGLAASLLARRGEVRELGILRRNLDDSEAAAQSRDKEAYARLVHEFHWAIVRGSDNFKLVEHYERLMNQLAYQRLVLRTVEHPGRIAASTQEHRAVLKMIEHKDPFGAESAMRNHVFASSREALATDSTSESKST
ncbi:GntR family transcriptional regulator [Arthrobacter sp. ISL-28]|uniref:GntR family transcriptional regulator n=1 Tax=Arthrobacter sp. ISL-28 TaxID=2819108 RepID=UPI001BEB8CA5|nr:GntR family transcriptional regulator [Arthrobacter sp. ISL-28]MBT2523062.1 GntR family transcriptional regulator [Arthrobacter sp. ISL-28]